MATAKLQRKHHDAEWTTADELRFVRRIGTHTPRENRGKTLPRPVLLQRYLDTMRQRSDWGRVDALAVRREVRQMLVLGKKGKDGTRRTT